jgi:hypothetical protein
VVADSLDSLDNSLNLLGLAVKLSKNVRECHVCLAHVIQSLISVLILEEDECECEFAFSGLDVTLAELDLEEVKNDTEVLLGFLVVVSIYCCVGVVLDGASEVLLNDELAPDLDDLLVEVLGIDDLAFLLEDFTHVVIAAAEIDAFRAIELGL